MNAAQVGGTRSHAQCGRKHILVEALDDVAHHQEVVDTL